MAGIPGLDPTVPPSGTGCAECEKVSGWWFHLRRCAKCGNIGCCDSSPSQHASGTPLHRLPLVRASSRRTWFWSYRRSSSTTACC